MHQIDSGMRENFFQWQGRLNRKRFLKRLVALTGMGIVLYILMLIVILASGGTLMEPNESVAEGVFGFFTLLSIPLTVSTYMLMIRRLHDLNLSGFFVLLGFVPLVSLGLLLYLLFKEGTTGDNSYGPDPLGAVSDAAPAASETYENPYARASYGDAPTDIAPPKKPQD